MFCFSELERSVLTVLSPQVKPAKFSAAWVPRLKMPKVVAMARVLSFFIGDSFSGSGILTAPSLNGYH